MSLVPSTDQAVVAVGIRACEGLISGKVNHGKSTLQIKRKY